MTHMKLFFAAAVLLAITPGPGLFYVMARSLAGGRREGVVSSFGTFAGGMVHVVAAACGLSVLLANSAVAFGVVKYAGAAYLIYLGVQTIRTREIRAGSDAGGGSSFRQGIWTEVLNPKTALFFLAFIPQFVSREYSLFWQFILLGTISVTLNTAADLSVAYFAGSLSDLLKAHPAWQTRQRVASGIGMIGLGVFAGTMPMPSQSKL